LERSAGKGGGCLGSGGGGAPGEGVRRTKSRPGSQHFPCYAPEYNNQAA
jgi:hypothetical protein